MPAQRILAFLLMAAIIFQVKNGAGQNFNNKVDSLKGAYLRAKNDTEKIKILLLIPEKLNDTEISKKIQYEFQALHLAENLKWNKEIGICCGDLSSFYFYGYHDLNNSIYWDKKKFSIDQYLGDSIGMGIALQNIGFVYNSISDHINALNYFKKAIVFFPDSLRSSTLANIGQSYYNLGDYPNALNCYIKAYNLCIFDIDLYKSKNSNDTLFLMGLLMTIGQLYSESSQQDHAMEYFTRLKDLCEEYNEAKYLILTFKMASFAGIGKCYFLKKQYDSAILFYKKSLGNRKALANFNMESGVLNDLASAFLETGQLDSSLYYCQRSLNLSAGSSKKSQDKKQYPQSLITIAKIKLKEREFKTALTCLDSAISITRQTGAKEDEKEAWLAKSHIYQAMHDDHLELAAYKTYITLRDSVFSQDKAKEITRIEMNGEFSRRQIADSLIQANKDIKISEQIRGQQVIIYSGFLSVGVVLFLAFFIYRNYTFQKKANAAIKAEKEIAEEQRQRAEKSEYFKQMFLANMSHEIRTPINAVSGLTDLLLDLQPRPDQEAYLKVIAESSSILLHIINDILDLSKMEAGKLELELIDFSLSHTLNQVKDTLNIKATEKGLHLAVKIGDNLPDILLGDPYRLNQILLNLGSNAIKFTSQGRVDIKVEGDEPQANKVTLHFSVSDTGKGIPAGKEGLLFGAYNQLNSSDTRKYGGTGLGLSISSQLVEIQGGTIGVTSEEGKGSTFLFTLVYNIGSREKWEITSQPDRKNYGTILNGLKILLVDDNEFNIIVARDTLLSISQISVDVAMNGKEAIEKLNQNDYDAILMDVQMPVMNGVDAAHFIRGQMSAPKNKTPIIGLTANLLRKDNDKCIEAGMNAFISKPFKVRQLIKVLTEVTGRIATTQVSENYSNTRLPADENINQINSSTVTNLDYLNTFCEGDIKNMRNYIGLYLRAFPVFKDKLGKSVNSNNPDEIKFLMHNFRPKWIMMGMNGVSDLSIKIEESCTSDNIIDINKIHELLELSERSVNELNSFV